MLKSQFANNIPKLTGGWQHSDIKIIDVACDVTSLAAVKEAKRCTIDKNGLFQIRSITNNLKKLCQVLGRGVGAPAPIQIDESSLLTEQNIQIEEEKKKEDDMITMCSDKLRSFPVMTHIYKEPTEELITNLSGKVETQLDNVFVNLYENYSKINTVVNVVDLLERSVQRCKGLQSKIATTSASIPLHQICTLIEHLFCETIPFPKPRNFYTKEDCIWTNPQNNSISLKDQRKGLNFLKQLANFYISSSYVLPVQDKHTESSRTIVLYAILAIFDSLVRINDEGEKNNVSPIGRIWKAQEEKGERPFWLTTNGFLEGVSLEILFPTTIPINSAQLSTLVNIMMYFYESETAKKKNIQNQSVSAGPMLLFDWRADPVRRITQFRVEQTDPTLDFVQCLLDFYDDKFAVVSKPGPRIGSPQGIAPVSAGSIPPPPPIPPPELFDGSPTQPEKLPPAQLSVSLVPVPSIQAQIIIPQLPVALSVAPVSRLPSQQVVPPPPPSVPSPSPSQVGLPPPPLPLGVPPPPPAPIISSPKTVLTRKEKLPPPLPPPPPPSDISVIPDPIVVNKSPINVVSKTKNSAIAAIQEQLGSSFKRIAASRMNYTPGSSLNNNNNNLQPIDKEAAQGFELKIKMYCAKESIWEKKGCPEFTWLRDIVALARLTLEPTPVFFEKNPYMPQTKFFPCDAFDPDWHYSDVTNTSKCGFRICKQKLLTLGSTHPRSPTQEENYTPSASSQVPRTPHFLVDLMNGRVPTRNDQKNSKEVTTKITEDDIFRLEVLPTFDNTLNREETIQFLSLMTVPYLNIPLLLNFFANNLIGALLNPKLQQIFECVIFESRNFEVEVKLYDRAPLLPNERTKLGFKYGLLVKELLLSPDSILQPLLELITSCASLCIGSFDSPFANLLLYFIRISVRVLRYRQFIDTDHYLKKISRVSLYLQKFYDQLENVIVPKLLNLIELATAVDNLSTCVSLRSHIVLVYHVILSRKSSIDQNDHLVNLLSSASYVISWHSKINETSPTLITIKDLQPSELYKQNRIDTEEIPISRPISALPLFEVFYIVEQLRYSIIQWAISKSPLELEPYLIQISKLSLHLIGNNSSNSTSPTLSSDTEESIIENDLVDDEENDSLSVDLRYAQRGNLLSSLEIPHEDFSLWKIVDYDNQEIIGRPKDEKIPGIFRHEKESIEVNLQTLEVYFRNRSLVPTPPEILEHHDFNEVIPASAQPYCVISSTHSNRKQLHVLHENTCYQIETWSPFYSYGALDGYPLMSEDGDSITYSNHKYKRYQLGGSGWFSEIFDSIINECAEKASLSFLNIDLFTYGSGNEDSTLPQMIFYVDPSASKKKLENKESRMGRFYVAFALSNARCFHVYSIIEIGRKLRLSYVFTSDCNWSLNYLQPSSEGRLIPWFPGTEERAGNIFKYLFEENGTFDESFRSSTQVESIIIRREFKLSFELLNYFRKSPVSFSNTTQILEEYLPRRILDGLIPEVLLDAFEFWKAANDIIIGYPREKSQTSSGKTVLEWWGASCFIHITLLKESEGVENWSAIIRRIPKSITDPNLRPMVLMNSLNANPDSAIGKLSARMVQLDSLSHILIWSYSMANIGEEAELSLVELPRLRLRFSMQLPESSLTTRKRLFSLDHSDLFMTEDIDINRRTILEEHANCFVHGLVMENRFNQLFILVPNFGLRRVGVRSCPFSTPLISVRNEKDWNSQVRTCYYLYPIHPSGSFAVMSSLAGSLYLIILRLLQRHYKETSVLLSSCSADSAFTDEESWILGHIKLTEHDFHPDAHAIRLRIAIMCLEHSPKVVTWDVEEDLYGYLHKYSHVSSICKLTTEEERLLLTFVTQRQDGTPIQFYTILRQRYLNALSECKARGESITLESPIQARFGGSRLRGLYVHADLYCKEQFAERTRHFYYNYKRPKVLLKKTEAVQFMMNLYDDSMSGQDFRTGFAAILELLMGRFFVQLNTVVHCPHPYVIDINNLKNQNEGIDDKVLENVSLVEQKEGARCFTANFSLVKLLVHSLYFRYLTPRGVPPETSAHFAALAVLMSMIDIDRNFNRVAWRIPTFPYQELKPQMDVVRKDAHPSMRQGVWGDVSEGKADLFEKLLTDSVVYHCGCPAWKDNAGFHFPRMAKQGYYSERGPAGSIVVNPETIIDCRPEIANFDCDAVELKPFKALHVPDLPDSVDELLELLDITSEDIAAFSEQPLSVIQLPKYIQMQSVEDHQSVTPFVELANKPAATTTVAENILNRIKHDIKESVNLKKTPFPRIKSLIDETIEMIRAVFHQEAASLNEGIQRLQGSLSHLMELLNELQQLQKKDTFTISQGVKGVELLANQFPLEPTAKEVLEDESLNLSQEVDFIFKPTIVVSKLAFLLKRQAGQQSWLNFHLLCRALMCQDPWLELYRYNPFLTKERCENMLRALTGILFRSVRVSQINTCVASTMQLISVIKLAIGLEMERRWTVYRKKISIEMKLFSLENSSYNVQSASTFLEGLVKNLNQLQTYTDSCAQLTHLKQNRRRLLTFIVFHYTNFNLTLSEQIMSSDIAPSLVDLAKRSCFYKGKPLVLPNVKNESYDPFINITNSIELDLSSSLEEMSSVSKVSATLHLLQHTAEQLAANIYAKRNYVIMKKDGENNICVFDPRFLVFEFVSNFLLKERQIDLINNFITSYREGKSSVHQMIMGAGKTTVICPLLALLLANGKSLVTLVIPAALLDMSRDVMRNCFSNVIIKKVYSFHFDRYTASQSKNQLATLKKLRVKIEVARDQRGVVCTTPEVIKSLMLMYVDLLSTLENKESSVLIPTLAKPFDSGDIRSVAFEVTNLFETANEIAKILSLWGSSVDGNRVNNGIALLDEVDVILHPLHSELNFPIGEKQQLPLSPQRWQLPFHLLDSLFQLLNDNQVSSTSHSTLLLTKIKATLAEGTNQLCVQHSPHLVLVQRWFYENEIKSIMAEWALIWLNNQTEIQRDIICIGDNEETSQIILQYISNYSTNEELCKIVSTKFSPTSIQFLNLSRDWVLSYLPHCLSKIDRVHYGLLQQRDLERCSAVSSDVIETTNEKDMSIQGSSGARNRQLLSVPFVGKDVPSQSSEFSHPDVLIGLTIFAYRYEGVRIGDIKTLIKHLKHRLSLEPGIISTRPCNIMFEDWLNRARCSLSSNVKILPLDVLQIEDTYQMNALCNLLGKRPEVIEYYLDKIVFPLTMHHQPIKLQASGQDLGSNMIFGMRMGFSGTPSDCLPRSLRPCHYEPGSEAKIIETLTLPEVVTVEILPSWDVRSLIEHITQQSFNALIDAGALITGMNNEQVARTLLSVGLPHMAGCVFLDDLDRKMIVDRTASKPIPLNRSGVPIHKRFSFYDQVHTTGMDIQQSINSRAVLLLGKDMTLRDYAQACWRMRGLGRGQSVHVIVVQEVYALIQSVSSSGDLLQDIINWLTLNSIKSEHLQHIQLCQQDIAHNWRKKALDDLMAVSSEYFINTETLETASDALQRSSDTSSTLDELLAVRKQRKKKNSEFDYQFESRRDAVDLIFRDNTKISIAPTFFHELKIINDSNLMNVKGEYNIEEKAEKKSWSVKCLKLFKETIDFKVLSEIPISEEQWVKVTKRVEEFKEFIDPPTNVHLNSIIKELSLLEKEAMIIMKGSGSSSDYDAEIVQEQEQQQQQQVETITDEEIEYSMERNDVKYWKINELYDTSLEYSTNFVKLSTLKIWSMLNAQSRHSLTFPRNLLLSVNHTKMNHRSSLQRRIRPVYVMATIANQSDLYSCILNLAEAETLRHYLFNEMIIKSSEDIRNNNLISIDDGNNVILEDQSNTLISLYTTAFIPGRCLFNHNNGDIKTVRNIIEYTDDNQLIIFNNDFQKIFNIHLQCIRFYNCDFKFSATDLYYLLDGLQDTSIFERKKYFSLLLLCHDKLVNGWESTSISSIFTYKNQKVLESINHIRSQLHLFFTRYFTSLISVFQLIDTNHDGVISFSDLATNFEQFSADEKYNTKFDISEIKELIYHLFQCNSESPLEDFVVENVELNLNLFIQLISNKK